MKSFEQLVEFMKQFDRVVVGFSGGVDSTLLLKAACDALGEDALGVMIISPMVPQDEIDLAYEVAEQFGLNFKSVEIGFDELKDFSHNPRNRCYICKKMLFGKILEIAEDFGAEVIVDGSNIDDNADYRPGAKAARELGVVSPFNELGFTKTDIREISREQQLTTWDIPSKACLASRIPYGHEITYEKLKLIENAETIVSSEGFIGNRVRCFKDKAVVEVDPLDLENLNSEVMQKISEKLLGLGFEKVEFDKEGYKTGKLNNYIEKSE